MSQERTIGWIDSLRALSVIAVILVHVSTPVVKMIYGVNMSYWWIGNIIDSSIRFCVPVFLMISGALLLGKDYSLSEFYKKRFLRVLLPFVFWFVIYLFYSWLIEKPINRPHGVENVQIWAINLFFEKGISKHFWYIYMIIVLYIFMPFIGFGIKKLKEKSIIYLLIGWVLLNLLHTSEMIKTSNLPVIIDKGYLYFRYIGYLILGFYLSKKDFSSQNSKITCAILFLLSILITALATYYASNHTKSLDLRFYNYLAINSTLQSIALFIWVMQSHITNKLLARIRTIISEYSYGIYLVHIIVIGVFFLNGIFWTMAHPLISVPLITFACLFVSTIIIYLLRKIPFGSYISG